jgi:translational activator of cytochrome c oxidase 1
MSQTRLEELFSRVRWAPLEDQGSTEDEKESISALVEALEEDEIPHSLQSMS